MNIKYYHGIFQPTQRISSGCMDEFFNFDIDVQNAIVEYNQETNPRIRNKIYSDKIAYAFDKLCENIINTFKFSYFDAHFEDVKQEVISFLVLNLHKFH